MLFHKISSVFFITLNYEALSDIISFNFPRCATNLPRTYKNCSDVMSSTSSRFYYLYSNAGEYTYANLLCLFVCFVWCTMAQSSPTQCARMLVILSLCFLAMVPWVSPYINHVGNIHKLRISSIFLNLRECEMGLYEVIDDVSLLLSVFLQYLFWVKVWD